MSEVKKGMTVWNGGIKQGEGYISTESKALNKAPFSLKTRFEGKPGTNPEELIAAAHSACFSMALSLALEQANHVPECIETHAEVTLSKISDGFEVTASHLICKAKVPNLLEADFHKIAEDTKKNCPISKLLKAKITLSASLES